MTTRVLFVCTGNICRSPLAEAVFRQHVQAAGLEQRFEIDSAATHDYHTGEPADPRARHVGERHGAEVTSRARPVEGNDFEHFDLIVAMDRGHLRWLRAQCPPALSARIQLMRDHEPGAAPGTLDVPDPYYDDSAAFERVYAMLDVCCSRLLDSLPRVIPEFLEPALRRATGNPGLRLLRLESAAGGCIHHAARIHTSGGDFFAKWNPDCDGATFLAEAAGLRALRAADSGLVVPEVVAAAGPAPDAPPYLLLECLDASGHVDAAALARGLAAIHRLTAPQFGFDCDTYCGSTRQNNRRLPHWPEFYAERRLRPLLPALATRERAQVERLCTRLPELLAHAPVPALVHGDLWSGNLMPTTRGPALFDPACAHVDREFEFGIATLFGGFSARFFSAYDEAWPLPAGWRERNPLYQIYHLLNHHLIFGGGYAAQAVALSRRYV